jgi:hypothetical protein
VGFGDEVKREAKTVVCSSGMVKLREKATLRREVFKSVREREDKREGIEEIGWLQELMMWHIF